MSERRRVGAVFLNDVGRANLQVIDHTTPILASFPRSGAIWARTMLRDVAAAQAGLPIGPEEPEALSIFSPPMGNPAFGDWLAEPAPFRWRLLKTHYFYDEMLPFVVRNPFIVLFRSPVDAVASHVRRFGVLEREHRDFTQSIINRVGNWLEHSEGYLRAAESERQRFLFVSYERMHAEPITALTRMVRHLGVDAGTQLLNDIVSNRRFESMAQAATSQAWKRNLWRGEVGTGPDVLTQDLRDQITGQTNAALERLRAAEEAGPRG